MHRLTRIGLCAALVLLAACGEDGLAGLKAKLVVKSQLPRDAQGRYRLDFGEVGIGQQGRRAITVENQGRLGLEIETPVVTAPFSFELPSVPVVKIGGTQELGFLVMPADEGPLEVVVELHSNGGDVTVVLAATGVKGVPGEDTCTFELRPTSLDFGNIQKGLSKNLGTRVANIGVGDYHRCEVAQVQLSQDTDPAFQLIGGGLTSEIIAGGESLPIGVSFTPPRTGFSFVGKVLMKIGPPGKEGAVVELPLKGSSVEPCPSPLPDGSCPPATAPIYLNDASTLYTFDVATKKATKVAGFKSGVFPISDMFDIGIDLNGLLVGISSGTLYTINPNTAQAQTLATTSQTGANGLTFLPDGRLVVAGEKVEIFDRNTKQFTTLVASGKYSTSGDIVGLPDGKLYWAVSGSTSDQLVKIDPSTGGTTLIGDIGVSKVWGLSYAADAVNGGVLYGFTSDGKYLKIDPTTGRGSAVTSLSGTWYGAATNPTKW
jgi:hypothetical protein